MSPMLRIRLIPALPAPRPTHQCHERSCLPHRLCCIHACLAYHLTPTPSCLAHCPSYTHPFPPERLATIHSCLPHILTPTHP